MEGMTLLEILMVAVIIALAASGLGFSLGAIVHTNLRAGASRLAAAVHFAYNRAVTHGTTVRIRFQIPGNTFSIEEAHAGVTLARAKEKEEKKGKLERDAKPAAAVDPWTAAQARLKTPLKPSMGVSPFSPLSGIDGKASKRYKSVTFGHGVQFMKLIVPHEPKPLTEGEGSVHFFPGGRTEHAVIQLGDGREGVYSIEIHPLTGRVKVRAEAYEPRQLLDDPEENKQEKTSEVQAP